MDDTAADSAELVTELAQLRQQIARLSERLDAGSDRPGAPT